MRLVGYRGRFWPPGWRHRIVLPAGLALAVVLTGPVEPSRVTATYQATADSNETAFEPPCLSWDDPHPERELTLAVNGLAALGYDVKGYKGAAFTKSHTLNRTVGDWSYFVHSHGDYYWYAPDNRRYTGFREDSGDCSQSVVFSKEIANKRAGRATNLVFISTCHSADSNTTMPGAFGIAKDKAGELEWNGPKFFVGYIGTDYDNDEETFETAFWDALARGKGAGPAFDRAMLGNFTHSGFDADWWGSYVWSGNAGPGGTCPSCL